jgi:Ca-activated chloride channel family protein
MTDGRYYRATDNETLVKVYSEIDKMEKSRIDVRQFKVRDEKYLSFAIIAFCLIISEMIVRNTLLKSLT